MGTDCPDGKGTYVPTLKLEEMDDVAEEIEQKIDSLPGMLMGKLFQHMGSSLGVDMANKAKTSNTDCVCEGTVYYTPDGVCAMCGKKEPRR